jgi:hypothetical protein
MTQIVGIEFCADFFKDEKECFKWIKDSEWSDLIRVKGFKLRRNAQARILTTERKRPVFQWTQGYGSHACMQVLRPISTMAIVLATGARFAPTDLPTPLPANINHEKEKAERHADRVAKLRAERAAKALLEPPKEKKRKKSSKGGPKKKKTETHMEAQYGVKLDQFP